MSRPTAAQLKSQTVQQFNATRLGEVVGAHEVFTDLTRPDPTTVPKGFTIWNDDEPPSGGLNSSNGTNWLTTAGAIT